MARGRKGRSRGLRGGRGSRGVSINGTNGIVRLTGSDRVEGSTGEEIVATLAAQAFQTVSLFMAPGIAGTVNQFPRMNALASLYSEFRWVACTVRYRTFAGSTTPGRFAMAATYDPDNDNAPGSVGELLATMPHVTGSVWKNHTLRVPCGRDMFQKNWYPCGPDAVAPNADATVPFVVKTATDLGSSDIGVGYLEIDWVIDFKNPVDPAMNPVV